MAKEVISEVYDVSAIKKQHDEVMNMVKQFSEVIGKGVSLGKAGDAKTTKEATDAIKQYADAEKKLALIAQQTADAQKGLTTVINQQLQVKKEATKQANLEAQALNQEIGAFDRLKAQLALAEKKYRDLAAAKGMEDAETKKALQTASEMQKKVADINKAYGNYRDNVGNYEGATVSLRTEMRNLTQTLAQMEGQGKGNSAEFKNMVQRLGELKDRMGDVRARAQFWADDARWITATTQAVQGVVGAYSIYQGVVALTGVENEELAKTMAKLQALMTIMMGLKQVEAMVNKDSMVRSGAMVLLDKARAFFIRKKTVAISENTTALVTNATAEKGAEAAGTKMTAQVTSSLGAWGLLIAAIIAAAKGTYEYVKWSQKASEASDEFRASIDLTTQSLSYHNGKINENLDILESYVGGLRRRGKTEKQIADEHIDNVNKEATQVQSTLESQIKKYDEYIRKLQAKIEVDKKSANSQRIVPLSGREGRAVTASETTQLTKDQKLLEQLVKERADYNKQLQGSVEWQKKFNEETVAVIRKEEESADARERQIELEKLYAKNKRTSFDVDKMASKEGMTLLQVYSDQADALERLNALIAHNGAAQKYADVIASMSTKIGEKRLSLTEQFTEKIIEESTEIEKQIELWQEYADAISSVANNISSIFTDSYKIQSEQAKENFDLQHQYLQQKYDSGILSQEQYNRQSADLESQYLKEKEERDKKEFNRRKTIAIAEATVNTALALIKIWSSEGTTATKLVLSLAQASAFAALISSMRTANAYAVGREDGPAEFATVGERGYEYIQTPSGQLYKTPNHAVMTYLGKGDRVYTHSESMEIDKIISPLSVRNIDTTARRENMQLVGKIDTLTEVIKNKRETHINISRSGVTALIRNGHSLTKHLNDNVRI